MTKPGKPQPVVDSRGIELAPKMRVRATETLCRNTQLTGVVEIVHDYAVISVRLHDGSLIRSASFLWERTLL